MVPQNQVPSCLLIGTWKIKAVDLPLIPETEGIKMLVLSICVGHEFRLDENEVCFLFYIQSQ